jgi:hypothetical protein
MCADVRRLTRNANDIGEDHTTIRTISIGDPQTHNVQSCPLCAIMLQCFPDGEQPDVMNIRLKCGKDNRSWTASTHGNMNLGHSLTIHAEGHHPVGLPIGSLESGM